MWSVVKTFAFVLVTSVLIWVWAEAESLTTRDATSGIEFVSGGADLTLRVADGEFRGSVRARLEGSTIGIDNALRVFAKPLRLQPGLAGIPAAPGQYTVDLMEALRSNAALAATGVSIRSVEPRSVSIVIDRLVSRELPTKATIAGVELDGEPTVSPASVTVRLTETLALALDAVRGGTFATVEVDAAEAAKLRDDSPQSVQGRVKLPEPLAGAPAVVVEPERASVTARLRSRISRVVVPSVQVWLVLPRTEGTAWDVEVLDPFIKDVTVTGPREQIEQIRPGGDLVPVAMVVLSSDELEQGVSTKQAVFSTLPAVQPLQFAAESRAVRLKITKRRAAPGGEPGGSLDEPAGPPIEPG